MSSVKGKEISFQVNKYGQPALLNDKDSLVQIILNALLMVPGNLPSQPKKGVNIFQYLYTTHEPDELSDLIFTDLKYTVGDNIGNSIGNLTVDILNNEQGSLFLLVIHLIADDENKEGENVAIAVQKVNEVVRYNYSFLSDTIKKMK